MRRAACVAVLISWVVFTTATLALAQFPGRNGTIVFAQGESRIQVTNTGAATPVTIRDGRFMPQFPRYSADGSMIVFADDRWGTYDISIMRADGTHLRRLTTSAHDDFSAAFSPNGRRLVFTRNFGGVENDLWIMDVDGGNKHVLVANPGNDESPSWSPDGKWIAFDYGGADSSKFDIWLVRPDGSDAHPVTEAITGDLFEPDWSPNGKRMVIIYSPGDDAEVATIRADGTRLKVLTDNAAVDLGPAYSPDGHKIVWTQGVFVEDLWLMRSDGTHQHLLLDTGGRDLTPGWRPRPG